jgi:hypothetical protein
LLAQPVNTDKSGITIALNLGQLRFSFLPRKDGAAVFGISTVSFLLPSSLDGGLALFDLDLPGVTTGEELARPVPLAFQHRRG